MTQVINNLTHFKNLYAYINIYKNMYTITIYWLVHLNYKKHNLKSKFILLFLKSHSKVKKQHKNNSPMGWGTNQEIGLIAHKSIVT